MSEEIKNNMKKPVELSDEEMEKTSGGNTIVCVESTVSNFTGTYNVYHMYKCDNPGVSSTTAVLALTHPVCGFSNTGLCRDCRNYTDMGSLRKDSSGPMLAGWEASGYSVVYK